MAVPILHSPIRPRRFLEQTCLNEEYRRKRAAGVTYVRGKHGGYDFQDRRNAPIYAVCDGTVRHVNFGAALGKHQFVIRCADGSGAFYAHTATRPPSGGRVRAGEVVARMGNSSSFAIGVHLHFETLKTWNNWHSTYNSGRSLRALQEVYRMFTADEVKFLKNVVKVARKKGIKAGELVKAVEGAKRDESASGGSPSGIPPHSHQARVTVE